MIVSRRNFLALASGLLVPMPEPVRRAYSFAPAGGWVSGLSWIGASGWRLVESRIEDATLHQTWERVIHSDVLLINTAVRCRTAKR